MQWHRLAHLERQPDRVIALDAIDADSRVADPSEHEGGLRSVPASRSSAGRQRSAGRVDPRRIVSDRLGLEDAPLAYELFSSRTATKVVMTP